MARSKTKGPVHGPYITFRLISRAAVAADQASTLVDRIPMPAAFRVCKIAFSALGVTGAAVQAAVTNNGGVAGSGLIDADAAVTASVSAATLSTNGFRDVPKGNALELRVVTGAVSTAPAGSIVAWVTGYFTDHIAHAGRYAESGQSMAGGPSSGYYDLLTFVNQRLQTGGVAIRSEGALLMPYAARVMAISYHIVGQTEATGSIDVKIRNATAGADLHTLSAADAWGSDATNGDVQRIDAVSTPALANRDIARGASLELHLTTGAADIVPLGALTAHVLVWVQGHVDFSGVVGVSGVTDRPSSPVGPALGGVIAIPFCAKRAAQGAVRTEDRYFLPVDLRIVAGIFSKQAATSTSARLDVDATQLTSAPTTTQNYISHNEATAFPAPGSWAGGVIATAVAAGEDTARRYPLYLFTLNYRQLIAGDVALGATAHVLCAVRSHVGGTPADAGAFAGSIASIYD
jgi:hypothetical protein